MKTMNKNEKKNTFLSLFLVYFLKTSQHLPSTSPAGLHIKSLLVALLALPVKEGTKPPQSPNTTSAHHNAYYPPAATIATTTTTNHHPGHVLPRGSEGRKRLTKRHDP